MKGINKGIEARHTAKYLCALRELSGSCRFYDTHVHPYEVILDSLIYNEGPITEVLSIPGRCYTPPAAGSVRFLEEVEFHGTQKDDRLREISLMLLKRMYGSVGGKVFLDQMELAVIDKVLLLPVSSEKADKSSFEARMCWINALYGNDGRFWIAGSVPPTLCEGEIEPYAARLQRQHRIRAMKCHPVVSDIDLGTRDGRKWLEALLAACGKLALPLIIHGGRNNPYWPGSRGDFGSIANLSGVDFSVSGDPVVLAHAAMHRCSLREMEQETLPVLVRMLEQQDNLFVDVSGLRYEPLKLVLKSVERERILFGSDALYTPQWEAVALTMHALKDLGMRWQEVFVQIACVNPSKTIFRGEKPGRP